MRHSNKRIRKKKSKQYIGYVVCDVSLSPKWREKLFNSGQGKEFQIDESDLALSSIISVYAIKKYRLKYAVTLAREDEIPSDLCSDGLVYFKFFSPNFPSVESFSANNPDIL